MVSSVRAVAPCAYTSSTPACRTRELSQRQRRVSSCRYSAQHTHTLSATRGAPRVLKLDFGEKIPPDTPTPELQVASLVLTLRTKSTASLRSGSAPGVGTTLSHDWLVTSPSLGLETPLCCVLWKRDKHMGGNCQNFFFSQLDGDTVDLMYV